MQAVGFEPTSANTLELKTNPLDRSGTLAITVFHFTMRHALPLSQATTLL